MKRFFDGAKHAVRDELPVRVFVERRFNGPELKANTSDAVIAVVFCRLRRLLKKGG